LSEQYYIYPNIQIHRHTTKQTGRQATRQTHRYRQTQTDRQADRQKKNTQADRQAVRLTDKCREKKFIKVKRLIFLQ
jgi:hypothetical protein